MDQLQELADGVLDSSAWSDPDGSGQLPANVTPLNALDEPENDDTPLKVARHSDDFKRHVFGIWAFEGTRSAVKTSRIVRERDGIALAEGTVRTWARQGDWVEQAETLHQTFVQSSRATTDALLNKMSVKAAEWALSAFDDPSISAGVKAKLALGAWDRTGHVPAFGASSQINVITNVGRHDLANKTDAELADAVASYQVHDGKAEPPPFEVDYREVVLAAQGSTTDAAGHRVQPPPHAQRPPRR